MRSREAKLSPASNRGSDMSASLTRRYDLDGVARLEPPALPIQPANDRAIDGDREEARRRIDAARPEQRGDGVRRHCLGDAVDAEAPRHAVIASPRGRWAPSKRSSPRARIDSGTAPVST